MNNILFSDSELIDLESKAMAIQKASSILLEDARIDLQSMVVLLEKIKLCRNYLPGKYTASFIPNCLPKLLGLYSLLDIIPICINTSLVNNNANINTATIENDITSNVKNQLSNFNTDNTPQLVDFPRSLLMWQNNISNDIDTDINITAQDHTTNSNINSNWFNQLHSFYNDSNMIFYKLMNKENQPHLNSDDNSDNINNKDNNINNIVKTTHGNAKNSSGNSNSKTTSTKTTTNTASYDSKVDPVEAVLLERKAFIKVGRLIYY